MTLQSGTQSTQRKSGFAVFAAFAFLVGTLTQSSRTQRKVGFAILAVFAFLIVTVAGQRGGAQRPPASPRAIAPYDFTGYWVSVVTEDWRWRMMTPAKGDYASVPLNAEAQRVADAWDPAKDEAAGEQCRSYGAPAIMRVPGRLHISWQDDTTLRIDTDAGTQTRLFHFGGSGSDPSSGSDLANPKSASDPANASWQGRSVALWEPGGAVDAAARRRCPGDR